MKLWESPAPGMLVVRFPAPAEPLSTNQAKGMHWGKERRYTDPWKDMALMVSRQALAGYARKREAWPVQPVTIQTVLPFRVNRRRDPHNYVGTVVKALVDGLVRGGVIPDDAPEWATVTEPSLSIQPDKTQPLWARVTITPRSLTP